MLSGRMNRAIFIMLIAMSLIPAGDTAGKLLTGSYEVAPVFVAWSRFVIGVLLVVGFVSRSALILFTKPSIWIRAALLTIGIFSIQTGLRTAPLADVFAAFFVGPIFSYVLAAIFLKEPISTMRSALIALGFCGVLFVVRPGGTLEPGLIWAFVAGLSYGGFLTMSRWLSTSGTPIALIFSQLTIAALILLPFGITQIPPMTGKIAGLTLASGACSMLGNLLLLYAYRLAPATKLAPLVYLQLIAAVTLGWAVFGQLPDMFTAIGLTVIVAAGLVSARLR